MGREFAERELVDYGVLDVILLARSSMLNAIMDRMDGSA